MAENIFNEKQDYIVAARDEVIKRDEYAANIDRMKQQQKKLSRSIASEEKSIADEIATTIKKRRQDIQSTYDDRLDDNRARKKKVANKRDKKKEERMDKRYHEETKSLREEIILCVVLCTECARVWLEASDIYNRVRWHSGTCDISGEKTCTRYKERYQCCVLVCADSGRNADRIITDLFCNLQ